MIRIECDGDMIPRHLPQAWELSRGVPIPDTQFFFVGEEGDGFVDGVGFFLNLHLRIEF